MKLSQLVVATVLIGSTFSLFAEESRYIITDLGDVGISAVNNSGQGVGRLRGDDYGRPVVTDSSGNVILLGTPETYSGSSSFIDINDNGKAIFNFVPEGALTWHAFVTDSNNI